MVQILKEVWKLYKRSILSSVIVILLVVGVIYTSASQGSFVWFPEQSTTGFFTISEVSAWTVLFSFLILLALFVVLFSGRKFM